MQLIRFRLCLVLLLGLSATGCSSMSEWYTCGVNCQYQPRPPLPYEQYPECVCHSHVVSLPRQTLRQVPESESKQPDTDTGVDDKKQQDTPAPHEQKQDQS